MATMVQPIDLSEVATLEEESLRSLLSDDALSPGERLLLVEARFVHDSAPERLRVQHGERLPLRHVADQKVEEYVHQATPEDAARFLEFVGEDTDDQGRFPSRSWALATLMHT